MIIANIDSTGLRIRVNISKFFITDYKKILFTTATIEELYYFAILCKTGYFREMMWQMCTMIVNC